MPDTLQNAAVRIVDEKNNNRIYVRQYSDGTKHMVVVDPQGKVAEQKPFTGGLITQFPYAEQGVQDKMKIDWERKNGEEASQGSLSPSRVVSAIPES